MISRRKFLQLTGATVVSLAASTAYTDLFHHPLPYLDENRRTEKRVYGSNLYELHPARAVAALENDEESVKIFDSLIDLLEDSLNSAYEYKSREDYLVNTVLEYSRRFSRKTATRKDINVINNGILLPRIIGLRDIIKQLTQFAFYSLEGRHDTYLGIGNERFAIPESYFPTLKSYESKTKALRISRSSEDNAKRLVANTIYNLSANIKHIIDVASEENVLLNILLGIATLESLGNQYSVGVVGEVGMFQIRPDVSELVARKYSDKFQLSSPQEALENIVRYPDLNARFAAILLNECKVDYPEIALAYHKGLTKFKSLDEESRRNHWYVEKFCKVYNVLEERAYLS